jgi:hypothetical protein
MLMARHLDVVSLQTPEVPVGQSHIIALLCHGVR